MTVHYIPAGFHSAAPILIIKGAAAAIEFYEKAFGATEVMRLALPDGKIAHAEIKIGDTIIMISDEIEQWGTKSPPSLKGTSVHLHLYVKDVDALTDRAVAAGATVVYPVSDQFYGDRAGRLEDPFGHVWVVATHKEDMSHVEMQRRMDEFMKQQAGA